MFAFENWHSLLELKLYMHRFLHAIDGMKDFSCLVFPKYNQFDSFVTPLKNFLVDKGVQIQFNTLVEDLDIQISGTTKVVQHILTKQDGKTVKIAVGPEDFVIATTSSMTESTFYGTNDTAPNITIDNKSGSESDGWKLWKNLATKSDVFGRPHKFYSDIKKSSWESATLTCRPSAFVEKLKELCVNDPYSGNTATGGIITITDSNWLMSFTCNRQPHFPTQPDDILVIWVYSLFMDKKVIMFKKQCPNVPEMKSCLSYVTI